MGQSLLLNLDNFSLFWCEIYGISELFPTAHGRFILFAWFLGGSPHSKNASNKRFSGTSGFGWIDRRAKLYFGWKQEVESPPMIKHGNNH